MGDMHRRVNSTEVEGDVKPRVIFAEEEGKEVVGPKENFVTQFKPQSRPIIPKVILSPRAWESRPDAWNGAARLTPPLQGAGLPRPHMERCSGLGGSRLDGSHELLASLATEPPVDTQWISSLIPRAMVIESHPRQRFGKDNVICKHLQE